MQNVNQTPKPGLFSKYLLALSVLPLLFSCSKNNGDIAGPDQSLQAVTQQNSSAQVSNSVEALPYERSFYVSCVNGGDGEEVALTGSIKIVDQLVYNEHGFTLTYNTSFQGTGIGLVTGETYRFSGGSPGTITGAFENQQFTGYYIEQIRIMSSNTTFLVNYKFHVTITADGNIITSMSEEKVDCRN
ncbi:MAG TPA: hypothetical protein VFO70_06640 [Chitinophagaceae bacterium]|nr:hypothetical protein [Chitinophagaceae bacterium]